METKTKTSKPKSAPAAPKPLAEPPKTPTPTPPPAEPTPPPVDAPAQPIASPEEFVNEKFEFINNKITDLTATLKALQTYVKVVQKELAKAVKSTKRGRGKAANANAAKKTPSGFAKPTKLSNALCDFLAVTKGTELARTDVTRRLNQYIKEHSLQDEKDKRTIHPDAKLMTILSVKPGDTLTFFNLQSFIKHNFVKAAA